MLHDSGTVGETENGLLFAFQPSSQCIDVHVDVSQNSETKHECPRVPGRKLMSRSGCTRQWRSQERGVQQAFMYVHAVNRNWNKACTHMCGNIQAYRVNPRQRFIIKRFKLCAHTCQTRTQRVSEALLAIHCRVTEITYCSRSPGQACVDSRLLRIIVGCLRNEVSPINEVACPIEGSGVAVAACAGGVGKNRQPGN